MMARLGAWATDLLDVRLVRKLPGLVRAGASFLRAMQVV